MTDFLTRLIRHRHYCRVMSALGFLNVGGAVGLNLAEASPATVIDFFFLGLSLLAVSTAPSLAERPLKAVLRYVALGAAILVFTRPSLLDGVIRVPSVIVGTGFIALGLGYVPLWWRQRRARLAPAPAQRPPGTCPLCGSDVDGLGTVLRDGFEPIRHELAPCGCVVRPADYSIFIPNDPTLPVRFRPTTAENTDDLA